MQYITVPYVAPHWCRQASGKVRKGAERCGKVRKGAVQPRSQMLAYQQAYKHQYAPGCTSNASQGTEMIGFWVGVAALAAQTRQNRRAGMGGEALRFLIRYPL